MNPEARTILVRVLCSHVAREYQAHRNFLRAMDFLQPDRRPAWVSADEVFHLAHESCEELEHHDAVLAVMYELLGPEAYSLAHATYARAPELMPPPEDFTDHAVSMALLDRAGGIGFTSMETCSYRPYAECLGKIIREEEGHENHGDQLLLAAVAADPANRTLVEAAMHRIAPAAYRCFGRTDTKYDQLGIKYGLKTRTAAENVVIFERQIAPLLEKLGLAPDLLIRHRR